MTEQQLDEIARKTNVARAYMERAISDRIRPHISGEDVGHVLDDLDALIAEARETSDLRRLGASIHKAAAAAVDAERAVTVARIRTLAETCGDGEVRRRFSDLASEIETGFHVLMEQQQEVPRG